MIGINKRWHIIHKEGGVILFVLVIILLSGFGLYALLQPPAEIDEEPAASELFPELKLSSVSLPEYSKVQGTLIQISTKEE